MHLGRNMRAKRIVCTKQIHLLSEHEESIAAGMAANTSRRINADQLPQLRTNGANNTDPRNMHTAIAIKPAPRSRICSKVSVCQFC